MKLLPKNKINFIFTIGFLFFLFLFRILPVDAQIQLQGNEDAKGKIDNGFILSNQHCTQDSDCKAASNGSCRSVTRKMHAVGEGDMIFGENYCGYPEAPVEVKVQPVAPALQINIPGIQPFTTQGLTASPEGFAFITWIADYFAGVYRWAVIVGGIIATVMIIFGGLQYLLSRGNAQQMEEAKSRITGAVLGLLLLLGSYTVLYLINPDLVQFKGLKIQVIKRQELAAGMEPTEIAYTKGMQCFFDTFGKDQADVQGQLVTVTLTTAATTQPLSLQVHKLMAPALQAVAESIKGLNYQLKDGGGFAWRPNVNNPSKLSLHSFGVAVDINPSTNPNSLKSSPDQTCQTDLPQQLIDAFKSNGFAWGGEFKTVCDAMHFEWRGPCGNSSGGSSSGGSSGGSAASSGTGGTGCCCITGASPINDLTQDECDAETDASFWDQGECQPTTCP